MAGILMTDPGFGRGQTLGVADAAQGTSVTGTQKTFTDVDPRTTNAAQFYSNRAVTCIAVRNTRPCTAPRTVVDFDATVPLDAVMVLLTVQDLPAQSMSTFRTGCAALDVTVVVGGPTAITTSGSLWW